MYIYENLSKRFSIQLAKLHIDDKFSEEDMCSFVQRDPAILDVTLYRDSFFLKRFTNVFVDCIKGLHKDIAFVLRNQYTGAQDVYQQVHDKPDFVAALNCAPSTGKLFQETMKFIIAPVLLKHGVYSPSICVTLFLELYKYMLCTYNKGIQYNSVGLGSGLGLGLPRMYLSMIEREHSVWSNNARNITR